MRTTRGSKKDKEEEDDYEPLNAQSLKTTQIRKLWAKIDQDINKDLIDYDRVEIGK